MDFYITEGRKRAREIISPIVDYLNGRFDKEKVLSQVSENQSVNYQINQMPEETELRESLNQYVETWLKAGSDFTMWKNDHKDLKDRLDSELNSVKFVVREKAGKAKLHTFRPLGSDISYEAREAAWLFARFITSGFYDRIGKCKSCDRFFSKVKGGKTKYCSRRCATGHTAKKAMESKRAKNREKKLKLAREVINKAFEDGYLHDFKELLIALEEAKISRHWFTRAVNKGELTYPDKEKSNDL